MLDLNRFPRVALCHQPTPLEPMLRMSKYLGGPTLWIKRDDCTGLATGGNKARKLEFLLGEALAEKADVVITQGAIQSNHVRQTAAATCRYGLDCHALLEHRVPNPDEKYETSGNVLLDQLFGITLEYRDPGLDMNSEARAVATTYAANKRHPYFIPGGGSNEVGALGYVVCADELATQAQAKDIKFDWLVMGTGSTGTQAGLVAGNWLIRSDTQVMGISVRQPRDPQITAVHDLAQRTANRITDGVIPVEQVLVDDGYVGPGYGIAAESTLEAIGLAARLEGILLDPVYSGKGFAGLVGLIRSGFFTLDQHVVFLHTGGSAALFAYEDILAKSIANG